MTLQPLLWVILTCGAPPPGYAADTQAPWHLTIRPARDAAVFDVSGDVAEQPRVTVLVRNLAGTNPDAIVQCVVTDYEGRLFHSGFVEASVPQGEKRVVELPLGDARTLPHEEYLSAKVTLIADGRPQADWPKGFGFLPRPAVTTPPETSPFGLLAESSWPLLQRLGVRWVRPNWSWAERPMEWARRYGIG